MRLYRSVEHAAGLDARGLIPITALMEMFSAPMFRRRADPDYASRLPGLLAELVPQLDGIEGAGSRFRMNGLEKLGLKVALALGL